MSTRHVSILVGRRRRFWSSQAASAAAQCLFLAFAIWLFPSGHDIQISASNYAMLYVFAAPRISYQPQTATKLQSKETGGVTGLPTAPRAALAHPSLPRAARLQKIDDVMLGNVPPPVLLSEPLRLEISQPDLPVATGMSSNVGYQPGRVPQARSVQTGGFTAAVSFDDLRTSGLTNRQHGPNTSDFGDGIGRSGGRLLTPVRIVSKPRPMYTANARARHIEGEVLIDVDFRMDGNATVVQIVQRLGYGLDETAVRAVEEIRFIPASMNGVSIDVIARTHVIFSLISGPDDATTLDTQ